MKLVAARLSAREGPSPGEISALESQLRERSRQLEREREEHKMLRHAHENLEIWVQESQSQQVASEKEVTRLNSEMALLRSVGPSMEAMIPPLVTEPNFCSPSTLSRHRSLCLRLRGLIRCPATGGKNLPNDRIEDGEGTLGAKERVVKSRANKS